MQARLSNGVTVSDAVRVRPGLDLLSVSWVGMIRAMRQDTSLDALPVRNHFRLRGQDMTRIETFTDAAFAFSLTLLVISFDAIPASFEEMIEALKQIPAFAASFAQIAIFWYAHHHWSRRMGLDDITTVVLSLTLVFVTLVYVFPLRIMFAAIFSLMTGNWLPFDFDEYSLAQVGSILLIYGIGFLAMSLVILLLHVHAYRKADELQLSAIERFLTRCEMGGWLIGMSIGLISCVLTLTLPAQWSPLAGMAYMLLPIVMPVFGIVTTRRMAQYLAEEPAH